MRSLLRPFSFVLAVGCGGGSTSPSTPAAAQSAKPSAEPPKKFDFAAEMKKEAGNLHPFPLNAPDGSFSASVSAVAPPKVTPSDKGSFTVLVDVASKAPIDCAVFNRRVDTASTMWNLTVEPVQKYPTKEVLALDIAMDDERPVVTLNMVALNAEKAAYVVKTTLVALPNWTVVCRQDEIGYAATIKAVTMELARTLKPATPSKPPRFHEVYAVRIGDQIAGFLEHIFQDNEAGDRTLETELGMTLVARTDGAVMAEDDISLTEVDNEGLIRTTTKASGSPQEGLTKKLTLKRAKGSEYEVDGEADGKKVHATFKSKRPLQGTALVAQAVVTNAHTPSAVPLVTESWASSTPTQVSLSTYTRVTPFDPKAPVYNVKADDDVFNVAHDEKGIPTHITAKRKDVTIELSRVFVRGNVSSKK